MASAAVAPGGGPRGLGDLEAARRLEECGRNELVRHEGRSPWKLLVGQFRGAMVWLLLGAAVLSLVLRETADAVAIAAILALNAIVGFFQEHRAERALAALRRLSAPKARVLRDGGALLIPASNVVPGDVLLLEAGDVVAADARLFEAHALRTVEALLTGESAPVDKSAGRDDASADRVFLGTAVVAGRGLAEVEATGMRTELGRVAGLLARARDSGTPLQRQLENVGRALALACVAIVAVVALLGLLHGTPWTALLLSAVALAVAALPEGLPAIVTIALALGVQRMAARNAIVRRLASVETLGCATVICTDKTGTLTTGRMEVRDVWAGDRSALLRAAAACCDATLARGDGAEVGDPTELALLREAARSGIDREELERAAPRVSEQPFDTDRRRMSVLRSNGALYVKGAPESVIPLCTADVAGARVAQEQMAARGLRVLAVAIGGGEEERDLRLLGLVGLADPPRPGVVEAIATARRAGVRTVMLTGDHPATARAIAEEIGLLAPGQDAGAVVRARVTPQDKIDFVRELRRRGEIVAMTGDGVNDAPALREADIGIAMGCAGTEVTREASDMVLTDDNFATIVAAVEEGRGIYDNIRKTLVYLLTGNAGELFLMLGAALLGLPLPLLPLQLLWINLVTDGLPALALVVDPVVPGGLDRPPRSQREPMLGRPQWVRVLWIGTFEAALVLTAFAACLRAEGLDLARAVAFSTLVFCELFRAFASRSRRLVYWQVGVFSNLPLVAVIGLSAIAQCALASAPFFAHLFRVQALSATAAGACLALGLIPVTVLEVRKLVHQPNRRS